MNVRKNAASLTAAEWTDLMTAFTKLKHTFLGGSQVSIYDQFVAIHRGVTGLQGAQTQDGAHGGPAFLPWHREYLRRFEHALQFVQPSVMIPYWNWGADISDTTALFSDDRIGPMGAAGTFEVTSGYLARNPTAQNPLGWEIHPDLRPFTDTLQRNTTLNTGAGFPTAATVANVMSQGAFGQFRPALESPHNTIHVRVGRNMVRMTSPNDPIFWLHHSQVDRIWAMWQVDHPGPANYNPLASGGQGHRLNDAMWPWDGGASQTTWTSIVPLLPTFADTDVRSPADVIDHHALGYCYDTEENCPCEDQPILTVPTVPFIEDRPTLLRAEDMPTIPRFEDVPRPTTFPSFEEDPPLTWIEDEPLFDPRGRFRRTPFGG